MFREGLTGPLASVIVPDRALQAVGFSHLRRLLVYVMHAHAGRPGSNQVYDHLVALLMRDALRPAVAAATHRIVKVLVRYGLRVGQLYPPGNNALLKHLQRKRHRDVFPKQSAPLAAACLGIEFYLLVDELLRDPRIHLCRGSLPHTSPGNRPCRIAFCAARRERPLCSPWRSGSTSPLQWSPSPDAPPSRLRCPGSPNRCRNSRSHLIADRANNRAAPDAAKIRRCDFDDDAVV